MALGTGLPHSAGCSVEVSVGALESHREIEAHAGKSQEAIDAG